MNPEHPASWPWHPELLARPVPRYTSFPTAAEFGETGADPFASNLAALPEGEPVSLYLHIPYCHEICWYCGCNTGAANRRGRLANYVQRLRDEIALVAATIGHRARVSRIAWGGGSPNALEPAQFIGLAEAVADAFDTSSAVMSVEVDPRAFTPAWSDALSESRTSRVSLGVQTFSPTIQAAIGRVQPEASIVQTVALLRKAGVESINFDLMYGLPGQTPGDLRESIDRTIALSADRVAVFGYAHVPHLIPRQRRIDAVNLPDAEQRFRSAELAYRCFTAAGYAPVGFDHFAKPGDALAIAAHSRTLRRNFQGFTEDSAEVLIGLGASAISAFPGALLQNEKNAGRYGMRIEAGQLATARGIIRRRPDRVRARAIERILCQGAADLSALPDLDRVRRALRPFELRDLIEWRAGVVQLTPPALPYSRAIAATLDPFRVENSGAFSNAV
ncbi:oxygen-independent coproporphyrinogen III oxidase [Sphingomonas sp. LB-2]|uniref:oxygen-independent coproporphyrinogen III oxidase n=1 Tax=Sphingomonas caeni TaxID=2984949 RepID=UPI00223119A6|nr:oxygen-independent coproporphyrinogen III oxidase [Sphingomonas caeni]MCW3849502.1 oxygen-independent coproporphyrinogen III oxidase [Sphingomonas caeni]